MELVDARSPSVAGSTGFPAQELNRFLGTVETHQQNFAEAWNEFFKS